MDAITDLLKRELVARQVPEDGDTNIGSARDEEGKNTSISGLVSALAFNLVIFAVLVLLFMVLRRANRRIYAPRTYVGVVESWRRLRTRDADNDGYADEVEGVSGFSGLFSWVTSVWKIPDETILRTNGLDGYFFLRYLRKMQMVLFVGCCVTWPILFPINITGGTGLEGLDRLAFGNVSDDNTNRYYAHVFVGWVFFSFVLFTVYRELVFYTTMRQAYMLSPVYSTRISARTVLITTVPKKYLSETALRKIFDDVKRIWIASDTKALDELVEERDKVSLQLEAAEVKLVKMADAARRKAGAAPDKDTEQGMEAPGESGSVAAQWLPRKKRPTHKLKPLIGEKVDTIDWCRGRLAQLNPQIEELQYVHASGDAKHQSSAFIEFETQSAAQTAFQVLAANKPLHMAPRYIGITPEEVIWSNLRLIWWERLVKTFTTTSFVVALVIFWSVPVAFVGAISNVPQLIKLLPWLGFINDIPEVLLGVITSILPTVALAILMALLPIILRLMAKIAGEPSLSNVELRVQNSYFLFQVVQVFLVTTLSSGAAAAISSIKDNPASAATLLATSLPKASNFYIAFFILQGLSISAGQLVQIAGVVLYKVLGFFLDNTPRKMWSRWSSLSGLGWGTVFPVYTNLAVIAITYSIIAPLVMGFAVIGLGLLYFAYRYNFLFVYNISIDTKGLVYPRALYQTLTGVYLAEICLCGLFGAKQAFGPMILQIIFLIFTVLFQMTLSSAIEPLLHYLPRNLQVEEEELLTIEKGNTEDSEDSLLANPNATKPPNFITKFLKPETYESYTHMRKVIPTDFPAIHYSPETERDAYYHPNISAQPMALWIPRDEGGVSAQEVAHTSQVQPISDAGAIITEKSKVERLEDSMPPDWNEKVRY